jgi:lipid-binding SYLF domain-containing protein
MCIFGTLLGTAGVVRAERRTKVVDRIDASATVFREVTATPEKGVPAEILRDAKCIAIVPGFSKGAFIVGGASGKGVATCRTGTGWSAPAPIQAGGASFGLEVGGAKSDVVVFLMNDRGKNELLAGKLKAGGDMSVAAGPVGASMSGSMATEKAALLSYSRTKGLFAGLALAGVKLDEDKHATKALYGRTIPISDILNGRTAIPAGSEPLLDAIRRASKGEAPPSS